MWHSTAHCGVRAFHRVPSPRGILGHVWVNIGYDQRNIQDTFEPCHNEIKSSHYHAYE